MELERALQILLLLLLLQMLEMMLLLLLLSEMVLGSVLLLLRHRPGRTSPHRQLRQVHRRVDSLTQRRDLTDPSSSLAMIVITIPGHASLAAAFAGRLVVATEAAALAIVFRGSLTAVLALAVRSTVVVVVLAGARGRWRRTRGGAVDVRVRQQPLADPVC